MWKRNEPQGHFGKIQQEIAPTEGVLGEKDLRFKSLYLVGFLFHFLLIVLACCRDTFSVLAQGSTISPQSLTVFWQKAEQITETALGRRLSSANPVAQALVAYRNSAGIEAGYGFFAPNVPNNYKLVFEVHNADDQVEYELPGISGTAAGLRLATLLDYIGGTRQEDLREVMLKMLAYPVWLEHPKAKMIRAVFGFITLPTPAEFSKGGRESYQFMYAYDLSFARQPTEQNPH